jgi:hypothetical protein
LIFRHRVHQRDGCFKFVIWGGIFHLDAATDDPQRRLMTSRPMIQSISNHAYCLCCRLSAVKWTVWYHIHRKTDDDIARDSICQQWCELVMPGYVGDLGTWHNVLLLGVLHALTWAKITSGVGVTQREWLKVLIPTGELNMRDLEWPRTSYSSSYLRDVAWRTSLEC